VACGLWPVLAEKDKGCTCNFIRSNLGQPQCSQMLYLCGDPDFGLTTGISNMSTIYDSIISVFLIHISELIIHYITE
jgi:hypothetical protein